MPSFSIGADCQYSVLVSPEDLERLTRWRWNFKRSRGGLIYARRSTPLPRVGGKQPQKTVLMHIYILEVLMGLPRPSPIHTGDHRNRNTLDNRRENLRWATPQEQEANKGFRVPAPPPAIILPPF